MQQRRTWFEAVLRETRCLILTTQCKKAHNDRVNKRAVTCVRFRLKNEGQTEQDGVANDELRLSIDE